MSADKLTRCPHCKAAFKVSQEQLDVANGRVRCGACMNIFDALAYSLGESKPSATPSPSESSPAASKPSTPSSHSTAQSSASTQASMPGAQDLELDDELIQDDPEADELESNYQRSGKSEDEFSTSFMELDNHDASSNHFGDDIAEPETAADDESWAQSMLEEESLSAHDEFDSRREPQISDNFEHDLGQSNTEQANSGFDFGQESFDNQSFNNDSFASHARDQDSEAISFYYDTTDDKPRKRHWLASTALVTVNLSLIVVLLALASWFHYEKLVKYPYIANLYTQTCELLGCTLPELSDVTKIKSHNLIVRSHPTTRNALIIDAVMTNQAGYAQDFPNLAIYFSDINNQTIAQRLIEPKNYLNEEVLSLGQMPSNEPIHISLEIVDPGKEAVNYIVKFFPATPDTKAAPDS